MAKEVKTVKAVSSLLKPRKKAVVEKVAGIKKPKGTVSAPSRMPAPTLQFKFDTARVKLLKSQGVCGTALQVMRQPFLLDDALVSITPMVPKWLPEDYVIPKTSVRRQIDACYRLLNNPLHGSPIIGIGSMVTDERAKFMAMSIMNAAIDQQRSGSQKGKMLPVYHRVMSGFYDELLAEKTRRNISMLIIANIGLDNSQIKLDKVRDLLEKYDNIPRIVVVNGCDPVSFFAEKMRMPMQFALMLNSKRSDKADLMDML
uniref:DNA polymerase n=1 Tax=Pseudomonas phage HRDY3 TaxID=3236930 RepID=A0AB39CEB7_9VIRU